MIDMKSAPNKTLVMIATYNEAHNVESLYQALDTLDHDFDVLFVDDNSPDGTGKIIERLRADSENLFILHRSGKMGVGSAHQAGIRWAYDHGYTTLLTMDSDFTHSPNQVTEFLNMRDRADIIIGSRFKRHGSIDEWVWYRKALTRIAHGLVVLFLGIPYDASGAFRVYNLLRIPRKLFECVQDRGYSFFWESLYILWSNGFSIYEIPIDLPARTYGTSKMRLKDIVHSFFHLISVWLRSIFRPNTIKLATENSDLPQGRVNSAQEWDDYWQGQGNASPRTYDIIAQFYRRYIIRPSLIRFITKYFTPKSTLLHAGCGGGEVDFDVVAHMKVTAMDFSPIALQRYSALHGDNIKVVSGSIESIPMQDNAVDGIYNLGVMEHFLSEEISKILLEFHRVTKPGGRVVLFWAPRFGLSVLGLKIIHFILNRILRKNIRLHPDEPSLIGSSAQAKALLENAGFEFKEYYFGIRDVFTYAVLVGEKAAINNSTC